MMRSMTGAWFAGESVLPLESDGLGGEPFKGAGRPSKSAAAKISADAVTRRSEEV